MPAKKSEKQPTEEKVVKAAKPKKEAAAAAAPAAEAPAPAPRPSTPPRKKIGKLVKKDKKRLPRKAKKLAKKQLLKSAP